MDFDKTDYVPIEKVIEDMSNPDGGMVAYAARDYYETHYTNNDDIKTSSHNRKYYCMIILLAIISLIGNIGVIVVLSHI